MLARALQPLLKGSSIWAEVGLVTGEPHHYVVKVGPNTYVDGNGQHTREELLFPRVWDMPKLVREEAVQLRGGVPCPEEPIRRLRIFLSTWLHRPFVLLRDDHDELWGWNPQMTYFSKDGIRTRPSDELREVIETYSTVAMVVGKYFI